MRRLADPGRCPECGAEITPGAPRCPSCGLALTGPLAQELFVTLTHADALLERLRQQPAGVPSPAVGTPASDAPPAALRPGRAVPPAHAVAVPPPGTRAVPHASVQKILLTLGAVCLLVAALVFIAVAWSVLGVAGRTAVLVALTVTAGGLTWWVARRGLRGATEALGLVTTGLAALDLVGARNAGWLGHPSDGTFLLVLGILLSVAGTAATEALTRSPAHGFTGGEAAAMVGAALIAGGIAVQGWGAAAGRWTVASAATLVVAAALHRLGNSHGARLRVAAIGAAMVAGATWFGLLVAGLDHLGDHPSLASVWGHLQGWPLVAAALLALAVVASRWPPPAGRVIALGGAVLAVSAVVVAPALDEHGTATTLALVGVLAGAAVALAVAPRPWAFSVLGAAGVASVYVLVMTLYLAGAALDRFTGAEGERWSGHPGGRFVDPGFGPDIPAPWVLPLCVLTLAAVGWTTHRALRPATAVPPRSVAVRAGSGLLGVACVATLLLYPVPVWSVLGLILLLTLGCAVPAVLRDDPLLALLTAVGLAVALLLGLYDEWLTLAATAVALVVAVVLHVRSARAIIAVPSGAAVPPLIGGLVWTVGAVAGAPGRWVALVGLVVLAVVALGRVWVPVRTRTPLARLVVEMAAALSGVLLGLAGVAAAPDGHRQTWLAVYLTVAGAAAVAMAVLRSDRREVGWLGGALLAAATWARLADLGVQQPEPYTLPTAAALLVVGLVRLHRHRAEGTVRDLGAGLTLALLPSLIWAVDDPVSLRALLLGLACLGLVVAGVRARWSAPLLWGAGAGAVLVVREAAPYVGAAVPRWGLIGAAGVLLIVLGVTWEQRLQDARRVSGRLRALR